MSFSTTIAKLLKRDNETRTAAFSDYFQLVRDAAADRPVTEAAITSTLTAANKTLADLEADVQRERDRLTNLSTVSRKQELLDELANLNTSEAAAADRFKCDYAALLEAHRAAGAAFQQRRAGLNGEIDLVTAAERSLTASDYQLARIRTELGDLCRQEQRVLARFGGLRSRVHGDAITTKSLARIDQRRQELTYEQGRVERSLLAAAN
jgi:hypothetical protein